MQLNAAHLAIYVCCCLVLYYQKKKLKSQNMAYQNTEAAI